MRLKIWILFLLVGLAIMAKPAKHRITRILQTCAARQTWNACRTKPTTGKDGEPAGWLRIPQCTLSTLVLEGGDKELLYKYPCHQNVGSSDLIMAHRDLHFRPLAALQIGDQIEQETRDGKTLHFQCTEIHILEKEECASLIQKYEYQNKLLLLTCYPFRYIGPAPQRFLVVATPVKDSTKAAQRKERP